MKKQGILSAILAIVLLVQILTINVSAGDKSIAKADIDTNVQLKGVWVSTVGNLDYPKKQTTDVQALKDEAEGIVQNCKNMGFNAIFLQVRPTSDAIYKSEIFPWSNYLTGSQGKAPDDGFDPLEYCVSEAHKNGIELHAWINPYRIIRNGGRLEDLANMNPAKQHPEYAVKYEDGYYYDPALPEVRELLISGVMEIINNYDVDGIHMDDYFYPGQNFDDDESYAKYGNGQDIGDWRRDNVNKLIQEIHTRIDESGHDVAFGISPSGVWANKDNNALGSDTRGSESYYKLYADTRKWALEGWIDYICPQIYWEIGHKAADYETLVNWWADTLANCDTKLYIGLADYKCDGVSSSSVWYNGKAIQQQLELNKSIPKIEGVVHFRYRLLFDDALYDIIKTDNANKGAVNVNAPATQITTQKTIETTTKAVETTTEATTKAVEAPNAKFDPKSVVNNDPYKILVFINGKQITFDQDPVLVNSRTLVPFRKIFEELGASVEWYNDTQQVIAKFNDKQLSLVIGEKVMLVNMSESVTLDAAPIIIRSRTMVPLRAISEALDMEVNWYNDNRVITIDSK